MTDILGVGTMSDDERGDIERYFSAKWDIITIEAKWGLIGAAAALAAVGTAALVVIGAVVYAYDAAGNALTVPSRISVRCSENPVLEQGAWTRTKYEIYLPKSCDVQKVSFDCGRLSEIPPDVRVSPSKQHGVTLLMAARHYSCKISTLKIEPK